MQIFDKSPESPRIADLTCGISQLQTGRREDGHARVSMDDQRIAFQGAPLKAGCRTFSMTRNSLFHRTERVETLVIAAAVVAFSAFHNEPAKPDRKPCLTPYCCHLARSNGHRVHGYWQHGQLIVERQQPHVRRSSGKHLNDSRRAARSPA